MNIEKILTIERAKHDMTIDDMCRSIGVSRNVYYNWLNKDFENVDSKYIIKLANLFQTTTDYILGLINNQTS